jgi:DNA invertase Pin-like site-specific DNA recombinase
MSRQREQRRAVFYTSEIIGVSGYRPELEKLIRAASKKPRPFDVVIVQSMAVLGTPEDTRNTIARLAEFGVSVEAVHPETTARR